MISAKYANEITNKSELVLKESTVKKALVSIEKHILKNAELGYYSCNWFPSDDWWRFLKDIKKILSEYGYSVNIVNEEFGEESYLKIRW